MTSDRPDPHPGPGSQTTSTPRAGAGRGVARGAGRGARAAAGRRGPAAGDGPGRALHGRSRPGAPPAPRAPATPGSRGSSSCTPSTPPATRRSRSRWPARCSSRCPTGEARGQVALFLGLTMLPFAIVAPLIGPFLDRFSHGRRWAVGATMAIRALPVLGAGDRGGHRLASGSSRRRWACLVASKAYGVTRAAAVPRLLPPDLTLVKANARVSLAGVVGAGRLGPDRGARLDGRAGVVAALRLRALRAGHDLGDPAARAGRLQPGRGQLVLTARAQRRPRAPDAAPHARARWRSRCRPTAGRAGSRASSPCSWRSCCATTRSATGSPEVLLGPGDRRRRPRQHPRHRPRARCCDASTRP